MSLVAVTKKHANVTREELKLSFLKLAIHSALTSVIFLSSATAQSETNKIDLPAVDVTAPRASDTQPVNGYNAK